MDFRSSSSGSHFGRSGTHQVNVDQSRAWRPHHRCQLEGGHWKEQSLLPLHEGQVWAFHLELPMSALQTRRLLQMPNKGMQYVKVRFVIKLISIEFRWGYRQNTLATSPSLHWTWIRKKAERKRMRNIWTSAVGTLLLHVTKPFTGPETSAPSVEKSTPTTRTRRMPMDF